MPTKAESSGVCLNTQDAVFFYDAPDTSDHAAANPSLDSGEGGEFMRGQDVVEAGCQGGAADRGTTGGVEPRAPGDCQGGVAATDQFGGAGSRTRDVGG